MQDPDIPPQAEGDTNDAVDGVRQNEERGARWAATAKSIRAFLPLPWITVTAPIWGATTGTAADRDGPGFPRPTRWPILSRFPPHERMPLRASSHLSKICSSLARFRTRAAR